MHQSFVAPAMSPVIPGSKGAGDTNDWCIRMVKSKRILHPSSCLIINLFYLTFVVFLSLVRVYPIKAHRARLH